MASRKTSAARAIKLLQDDGFVRGVPNAVGTTSLVLTSKGASLWNDHSDELFAVPGEKPSLKGPTFHHRQIADGYLVSRLNAPEVRGLVTEFSMNANTSPIDVKRVRAIFGKLPDGLVFCRTTGADDSTTAWIEWVEAESAYKKPSELNRILAAGSAANREASPIDFARPFRDLELWQWDATALVFAISENNYDHIGRIQRVVWDYEENSGWHQMEDRILVGVVPLRRYSLTLNGTVGRYLLKNSEEKIKSRLQARARAEMTPKEIAAAKRLEEAWISKLRIAHMGKPGGLVFEKPDFGFEVRQARPHSRRPPFDLPQKSNFRLNNPIRLPEVQ